MVIALKDARTNSVPALDQSFCHSVIIIIGHMLVCAYVLILFNKNSLYKIGKMCYNINMENKNEVYLKNALVLAYLGDSVFSTMVRAHLVTKYGYKPSGLNKIANSVVCAKTQAVLLDEILPKLNETEQEIVMRARNSHINSKAKHSTLTEYSKATQFEALIGYWFLTRNEKLNEIFNEFVVDKL